MANLAIWSPDRIDGYSWCACGKPASMLISGGAVGSDFNITNAVVHLLFEPNQTTACAVNKMGSNDFSLTVPKEFESKVQVWNSKGKRAYITADVYENGSYLGNLRADVYCVIDTELYKPIITNVSVSKIKALDGELLKGYSSVMVSATVDKSMLFGAGMSSIEVTVGSEKKEIRWPLIGNTASVSLDLPKSGSCTINLAVLDSRGVGAYSTVPSVRVLDYERPEIESILVQRCLENGNIDDNGLFISMTPNYTFHSVGGRNSIAKTEIFTKPRSENIYTLACNSFQNNTPAIFGGAYETKKSYDVKVVITDKAGCQATYVDYVTTGSVGLELYRNQAAAFGKPVEQTDGLELAERWNFYAHEDAYIDKDAVIGGNVYVGGKVIELSQDVYQIPTGQKGIVDITNMVNGDFVMIDFLLFTVTTSPVIEPHKLLVYYSGTNSYINFFKPATNFYEHIFATSKTGGAQVELWRVSTSSSIQAFYKVNSVITNSKGAVINFQGTRL